MGQCAPSSYLCVRQQLSADRLRPQGALRTGEIKMQTEGIRKTALSLIIVLATSLSFCRPLAAQHVITNLPHFTESGENPVSFMRPHYSVFTPDPSTVAATTPGAPPTTAPNADMMDAPCSWQPRCAPALRC